MKYNKCLKPDGYDDLPEAQEVVDFIKDSLFRYEHEHRKWEYGLALKLIREFNPKTVLNVGGGASPLSSLAVQEGAKKVTEIDPTYGAKYPNIEYIYEPFPVEGIGTHELVICTSVIEHVENDKEFFRALLEHSDNLVFITTDFHPSGKRFSYAHSRTYNEDMMDELIEIAHIQGFVTLGDVDYFYKEPMVYEYTFAALALVRVKDV